MPQEPVYQVQSSFPEGVADGSLTESYDCCGDGSEEENQGPAEAWTPPCESQLGDSQLGRTAILGREARTIVTVVHLSCTVLYTYFVQFLHNVYLSFVIAKITNKSCMLRSHFKCVN